MKNLILIFFLFSITDEYILLTEQQAEEVRAEYSSNRELNPIFSPGANSYALPIDVLSDTNFNSVIPLLQGYNTQEMSIEEFWQTK